MGMPSTFTVGDSLSFLLSYPDYPAGDGWTAYLRLASRTPGNTAVTLDSTASGSDHQVTAAASVTAGWAADEYSWVVWVTKGSERKTLDSGQCNGKPDPTKIAEGFDGRSADRKALDDARQAFREWDPTRKRYKIGGREMEFNSAADILVKVRHLEQVVAREELLAGKTSAQPRRIFTRL